MNKVSWSIFAAVVVLLLGGLIVYSQLNRTTVDVEQVDVNSIIGANEQNGNIADHVFNDTESKVVLVEYGDYQCPGCGAAHPNIKTLLDEYGDRISFVFRNLPLTSIHPNARAAASAAEAAGLQGKFWEMNDFLFESQSEWQNLTATQRTDAFVGYADTLGLDGEKFREDYAGQPVNMKITFDQALAKKAGATSTPAFFLNGEALPEDQRVFVTRMAQDNEALFFNDAAIAISWAEMVDRALFWENYLQKYPKSHFKADAKKLFEEYQYFIFFGSDNTPVSDEFAPDTWIDENALGHIKALAKRQDTALAEPAKKFLTFIKTPVNERMKKYPVEPKDRDGYEKSSYTIAREQLRKVLNLSDPWDSSSDSYRDCHADGICVMWQQ